MVKEFACKDGSDEVLIDLDLVNYLQKNHDYFGKTITINSGYRTPSHNASISGAARNSYHTKGQAADIVVNGVSNEDVAKYAEAIGILGIEWNVASNYVHLDTRNTKWFVKYYGGVYHSVDSFKTGNNDPDYEPETWYSNLTPADVGTGFYARIKNQYASWYFTNNNGNIEGQKIKSDNTVRFSNSTGKLMEAIKSQANLTANAWT